MQLATPGSSIWKLSAGISRPSSRWFHSTIRSDFSPGERNRDLSGTRRGAPAASLTVEKPVLSMRHSWTPAAVLTSLEITSARPSRASSTICWVRPPSPVSSSTSLPAPASQRTVPVAPGMIGVAPTASVMKSSGASAIRSIAAIVSLLHGPESWQFLLRSRNA